MLKEVQTWGMFLQKLGLPDKRDIPMRVVQGGFWHSSRAEKVMDHGCYNFIFPNHENRQVRASNLLFNPAFYGKKSVFESKVDI